MATTATSRIHSIDILRGFVMIVMALDHVRDFFHITAMTADPLDPATTSVPLFFTRWITHFCAPVFVFLSGISASLSRRNKTKAEAAIFMVKRGFWLLAVELVGMTFIITFNPFYNVLIFQVIWVIGWSMILLGLCSRISYKLVLFIGALLFFGHNILDYIPLPQTGVPAALWRIFFTAFGTIIPLGGNHFIFALYAVLPWTGVMFMGYVCGYFYNPDFPAAKRRLILFQAGIALIVLFVFLRVVNQYGDPSHWKTYPGGIRSFLSFLNASKYPPSLVYLCMTLGPGLLALSFLEKSQNAPARFITAYGQVPFFYYVLHFFGIHALLVIFFFATGHTTSQIVDPNLPFFFRPADFGYDLPIVYLIWILVVLSLYFPCKWFSQYKKASRKWWLSYL
ncbi:DUF1624 domain-containing protein [Flavihumibacter profundi]|uniref:DUF1624 domain-containing protein n=1 Tax=Flavihumibacter profundi TaxID=2716883 RepID=UPI001CC46CAC|nr:heparan-alpha-glucosaminide N-acetyltransferase domain-containing protein [Flavihumibacter profundi]MBZ5859287.1 heparan-alpha-glucosaminide N-acetyltransferase domain-containing protein [Flavihumibacter profundi]